MKIILSQRIMYHNGIAYDCTERGWYSLLQSYELLFLPNILNLPFDSLADAADAFIITGGDDSKLRRTVETRLATYMMQRNKPVIGVCHGAFLITDLLGGIVEPVEGHRGVEHSLIYNNTMVRVNSHHDLAITRLHSGATPLCVDEQGHVEAFIDGNLAGVVWHPERMEDPWLPTEILNLLDRT